MILLPLSLLLFVVGVLLEEASVWFTQGAVPHGEEDADEADPSLARRAREARLAAQLVLGAGAVCLGLSLREAFPLGGAVAGLGLLLLAAGGAGLLAVTWRSPLGLSGRAVFHGIRRPASFLRWPVRFLNGLAGVRLPAEAWVGEADLELRWLGARTREEPAGKVMATLEDFREALAEDVMVPRNEVVGLAAGTTVGDALGVLRAEGFTRYPVYQDSLDRVTGVLHVFDLLGASADDPVESHTRPAFVTNATKPVSALLRELQVSYNQMAVLVDEFGGTAGVVTVEDLLEELVGEIRDESDEEETEVRPLEPGVWWVDAGARIDDLNEELDLDLAEGDYDTLSGLVLERLERIPRAGEKLKLGDLEIEVLAAEPHRVRAFKLITAGAERPDGKEGTRR